MQEKVIRQVYWKPENYELVKQAAIECGLRVSTYIEQRMIKVAKEELRDEQEDKAAN